MFFFLLTILGYDIWFYVSHRILHHRFLYPIHAIHHEKMNPTFLDTYHGHWFEMVFQSLGFFTPLLFFDPCWLSFGLALLYVNAKGLLRHDKRGILFVGDHHLIHHQYPTYNYGEIWLDQLCGTRRPV
jgi:sterol desaturase/sphingolipid hydroxylase (fatty acid hydroxylase superfamily)